MKALGKKVNANENKRLSLHRLPTRPPEKSISSMWIAGALVVVFSFLLASANADADEDQYEFLTEFYELTSGEMWVNNTNWLKRDNNTSLCNWFGIVCAGKWVQEIHLPKNGLGGRLPDRWERVPYLEDIDLSSNKLLGPLPASIGNLSLDTLFLSGNSLSGTVPSVIGHTNPRLMYLSNNMFSGTLPGTLAGNKLQGFTIDSNKFTGPFPSEFEKVASHLLVISAAFNSFTGVLPVGVCKANACNFEFNPYLGCPSQSACGKCYLPLCNCGKVCYSSYDCQGGSCPTCSPNSWGVKTCGGK